MELNLQAKEIYEKEFSRANADKGYDIKEINDYLDLIIEDYMQFEKIIMRYKELKIENQNLKIKIDALKTAGQSTNRSESGVKINSNVDVLQRIARLEQAVFGKKQ